MNLSMKPTLSRKRSSADVEMQPVHDICHDTDSSNGAIADSHVSSLALLFGLSKAQLLPYAGARSYCKNLEMRFRTLLDKEYNPVWDVLGKHRPQSSNDCWPLIDAICNRIPEFDYDTTIENVCEALLSSKTPQPIVREACFIAVFSVLCWSSMALDPELRWAKFEGSPSLMVRQQSLEQRSLRIDMVKRPVSAIFRHFHRAMSTSRWRHPIGEGDANDGPAALEVSCLNYACLRTIGKIRLVWVDDLASHLDFDAAERTLCVFKFPTFCALSILGNQTKGNTPFSIMLQKG
jgi:hypothetical protein